MHWIFKANFINVSSAHSDHNNNFFKQIIFLQIIMECFEFYQYFECFQPLWETVWQGTVMGWRSQAARRPRMPSPDYFSVVPTLMDPTLTSKYFMDLSILLYSKSKIYFICIDPSCFGTTDTMLINVIVLIVILYYDSYQMYIL